MSGKLVLCGTPIGNLEDISQRALKVIGAAEILACEDTRRTRKLLAHYGLEPASLVVLNDVNERRKTPELLERMQRGATVVVVSDAGMPGLSDPGYRLVRACADAGVPVEVVPGPSAAIAALSVSGLPPGRFVFEGFLPRRSGDRRRKLEALRTEPRTAVVFVAPHRLEESLTDLLEVLGDRPAALVRELTKLHEEVRRGSLSELLAGVRADPPRGEIVLVLGGAIHDHRAEADPAALARDAIRLMQTGVGRREAIGRVAREAGVAKREVFDALVGEKQASEEA